MCSSIGVAYLMMLVYRRTHSLHSKARSTHRVMKSKPRSSRHCNLPVRLCVNRTVCYTSIACPFDSVLPVVVLIVVEWKPTKGSWHINTDWVNDTLPCPHLTASLPAQRPTRPSTTCASPPMSHRPSLSLSCDLALSVTGSRLPTASPSVSPRASRSPSPLQLKA